MDTNSTPTGAGTLVGYARVSTGDQDPAGQVDTLHAAGCARVFTETASGSLRERPELDRCLDYLRPGDVLVVAKLDRLGRSLGHLIETVTTLDGRGIGLRSLGEAIDTTTAAGRLLLHVLGAVSQFERDLIIERTYAGLAAARSRGRTGGRPPKMDPDKVTAARALIAAGSTVGQAAKAVGVGRSTLYRHLGDQPAGQTGTGRPFEGLQDPRPVDLSSPPPGPPPEPGLTWLGPEEGWVRIVVDDPEDREPLGPGEGSAAAS